MVLSYENMKKKVEELERRAIYDEENIKDLNSRIKELETKLYFCNRNNQIDEVQKRK